MIVTVAVPLKKNCHQGNQIRSTLFVYPELDAIRDQKSLFVKVKPQSNKSHTMWSCNHFKNHFRPLLISEGMLYKKHLHIQAPNQSHVVQHQGKRDDLCSKSIHLRCVKWTSRLDNAEKWCSSLSCCKFLGLKLSIPGTEAKIKSKHNWSMKMENPTKLVWRQPNTAWLCYLASMIWHRRLILSESFSSSRLKWISPWTSSSGSTLDRFTQLSSPDNNMQLWY